MRHLKYPKNCEYCKKEFIATRRDAKYCSSSCSSISYRISKMESGGIIPERTEKKPVKKEELIRPDNVVMPNTIDVSKEVSKQLAALENKKDMAEKKKLKDEEMRAAGKFWCGKCKGYFNITQCSSNGRFHNGHLIFEL